MGPLSVLFDQDAHRQAPDQAAGPVGTRALGLAQAAGMWIRRFEQVWKSAKSDCRSWGAQPSPVICANHCWCSVTAGSPGVVGLGYRKLLFEGERRL